MDFSSLLFLTRTFHAEWCAVRPPPFVKDLLSVVPCESVTAATCDKHTEVFSAVLRTQIRPDPHHCRRIRIRIKVKIRELNQL
jgi:hypothetical protein